MVLNSPGGLLVTFPITVDLMKLAASLEARGISRKLAGSLRTAWRVQSCLADLRHAQGACDSLDTLSRFAETLDAATAHHLRSGALVSAILLYARATNTGGPKKAERGAIQLDPAKLTPSQVADHEAIIRVRNSALGHVESGAKIVGDYWHRDFLFAKRAGRANWNVAAASTFIGFHDATFAMLKRLLPVAAAQLETKCQERLEGAMQVIRDLGLSDVDLLRYQVNPVEWFGSLQAAQMALGGKPGEEYSGWTPLVGPVADD